MKDNSASITGQITLDGKPTAGLEVALSPQHHFSRDNAIPIGRTDSTGRYLFSCLPMGRYWLKVDAPGYIDPFHWHDEGPRRAVSVADGEFVVNADLDLVLGGVITGRVTEPDGRVVVGKFVELTMIDKWGPPDEPFDLPGDEGFFTNGNGEYRIYGIPPGRYLVSIGVDIAKVTGLTDRYHYYHWTGQVCGDHYFEQTFYPGTTNRSQAAIVDVSIGALVRDVNINVGRPIRAYTVTGRVIHGETRIPIRHCYLQLGYYTPRGGFSSDYIMDGESDTDENGNFRVEGLLPGCFFISARAQFEGETELYCTPVEFEIKSEDLEGLEVKAHWGQELKGLVVIEGAKDQAAMKRLAQLKLCADTRCEASRAPDSRTCNVKSDGSFVIRGLRPGTVHLSLEFEETSRYFSIVRIEYPDDAGEIVSNLPPPMSFSPKLPSFCPPATANDLPPVPAPTPMLKPESHPLPPASRNEFLPTPMSFSPKLPSFCPPATANNLPPVPAPTPMLTPETHPLPLAPLNESLPTITQWSYLADSQSSQPRQVPCVPPRAAPPQLAPVADPPELPGPRFPGDLPPLQLGEHGLSGVRLVLSYKNGSIRGHVTFNSENVDYDRGLHARISHSERNCWPTSTEIDPNGDFFIDGLAAGEYEISILSESKTIVVDKNSESRISFVI